MSKLKFDCKTSEARLPIFITNTIRLQPSQPATANQQPAPQEEEGWQWRIDTDYLVDSGDFGF